MRRYVGGWLALAVMAAPAAGQQGSGRAGPLEGYIQEAIRSNLTLRAERLAEAGADAAVGEARSLMLPSVAVHARYSEATGVLNLGDLVNPAYAALNQLTGTTSFPTDVNAQLPFRQETTMRLTQPLFNPAIAENYRLTRRLQALQGEQVELVARQLAADVQVAWLDHARAAQVVALYRNTLPLLDENQRVNERLLSAGKVTPDALFRARAERSAVEQQLAEAEVRQQAARQAFNLLLDRPLDAALELLPDSLFMPSSDLPLDEALASARARREELRQAELGVQIADSRRGLARSSRLPTVALAVDYGVQGSDYRFNRDSDFTVASLVLQWNAFNGGRTGAQMRQASADREQATVRRQQLEKAIALQVEVAHRSLAVSRSALMTADQRLQAARRTFELVSRRYDEGMAAQVEYLDARVAYTSAELNRILTQYDVAVQWVELERVAGLR